MDKPPRGTALERVFETLIGGVFERGYGLTEGFVAASTVEGLRQRLLTHRRNGEMYPAGVGRHFDFQHNAKVRGDVIRWIDNDSPAPDECDWLAAVGGFISYLNRSCYTGLCDFEFHYASYQRGSGYARHLDQFRDDKRRKFSLLLYLNDNWTDSDGGELVLYPEDAEPVVVAPLGGRVVFFRSDQLAHEVRPSLSRERLSLAGWLKAR
ncbi:MAG: 2OG-Fe(II) oxygenase [Deltaproteobacteria bacterium]|nr:2OG-Fe(II) oxygenase [Deltaproteobacteria bacterium]